MRRDANSLQRTSGASVRASRLLALLFLIIHSTALAQFPGADSFNPSPNNLVYTFALQTDEKVLVGGDFTILGGLSRSRIARLNVDGSVDVSFSPQANNRVYCVAVQPDGKILIGGSFTNLSGQNQRYIGRLNQDGSMDLSFTPLANGLVYALALQADGKILVSGSFTTLGGQSRNRIGRLNVDGTVDPGFSPGADDLINSIVLQPDGKILVGGWFYALNGQPRSRIGRLNENGTLDLSFNPGVGAPGPVYYVSCLANQRDGKVLVGGFFHSLGGAERSHIGRLNANGTVDATFNPGASGTVSSLAVQADGKILVGGVFTTLGGENRSRIGRVNAEGAVDSSFDPGANSSVNAIAVAADGKILLCGGFTTLGGQNRTRLGRLNNTEPATQELSFKDETVTWLRGSTSPEVWRTTFDVWTGTGWTDLGVAGRITGGWELNGLLLAPNSTVRARGYAIGGYQNGSTWFVESMTGLPAITQQPVSRTNGATTTASFSVDAAGTPPMAFQWVKSGVPLTDGGKVSGANTPVLTLTNVLNEESGDLSLIISNNYGCVTSTVAALTVVDPFILNQPANESGNLGENLSFNVTAAGTPPLSYQWSHKGAALAGATNLSLTLSNLSSADAGNYEVIVSNAFGSITSALAWLSVNLSTVDSFNPTANSIVYCLALQPDGKILLSGSFTLLNGESRRYFGRLNPDGTVDPGFNPGAASGSSGSDGPANCLALLSDGSIVVAGTFYALAGQSRRNIGRLHADGSLDTNFNPYANGTIFSMAVQPDDKIVVAGDFTTLTLAGQSRSRIARLNADGSLDLDFNPGADDRILSLALQPDRKILLGGSFTNLAGQTRNRIGRLNADGTLDPDFNPGVDDQLYSQVYAIAVQPDGRILVGGSFTNLGGASRANIGRLNADGSVDTGFNPGADGFVGTITLQTDGKILAGGGFHNLGGQSRDRIGRLNADGTVDTSFSSGADSAVNCLALQSDGKIVVGGWFATLAGQSRSYVGRLNSTAPATQMLSFDGNALNWERGGNGPEVERTTFERWNSTGWSPLGEGSRVTGGWRLNGITVLSNAAIRARGYTSGGRYSGSSWFIETVALVSAPLRFNLLTKPPAFGTNGFTARVEGLSGQSPVVLLVSTNLTEWSPLLTNPAGPSEFEFLDGEAANRPRSFYRAVEQ